MREIMRAGLGRYRDKLGEAVGQLAPASTWPATGPRLVYRGARETLLHPSAPPQLQACLEAAVERGMLVRSPSVRGRLAVELASAAVSRQIAAYVRQRRKADDVHAEPRDLLDAVVRACPAQVSDDTVAQLYRLMFGSVVANVGYTVAWALLLACTYSQGSPWPWTTDSLAREAARHRPLVWMVGRPVPHAGTFGGVALSAGTVLSVSPYLLHHDPACWSQPDVFRPERWAEPEACGPYLPFSAGPFTCAGAAVAHTMVTDTVGALTAGTRLQASHGDTRPLVTNASIPRGFTLHHVRSPHHKTRQAERR
ncbi:cytochrome P450 [Kitasatospora sp. NPDC057542]|uniref:cytochrome P450 n=1 Tax=Kitasatospora sp. NPDC057542 TaxID=3346162 RepID=UPI0036B57FDD